MKNIFKMLKEDHKKVKKLFQEHEGKSEKAHQSKKELADKIFTELEIHAKIEEDFFYPAAEDKLNKEGQVLIAEALAEHKIVKELIEELKVLDIKDIEYEAKFKVLKESVEHHIDEEENEMFPKVEKNMNEETEEELFDQMKQEKQALMSTYI